MKILLECSDGGHLNTMMNIVGMLDNHQLSFLTFDTESTQELQKIGSTYFVSNFKGIIDPSNLPLILQEIYIILYLFRNSYRCLSLLHQENPDLIISTGGPVTIPLFLFSKLFSAKTVYIESITRVNELSGTGKVVYKFSDYFIVQWDSLIDKYDKAIYWGRIF